MRYRALLVAGILASLALMTGLSEQHRRSLSSGPAAESTGESIPEGSVPDITGEEEVDLSGRVERVYHDIPLDGFTDGIQMVIRTDADSYPMDVAPEWYLHSQDFDLEISDEVKVRGSLVRIDGERVLIPSAIVKGEQYIRLRTDEGAPLWLG